MRGLSGAIAAAALTFLLACWGGEDSERLAEKERDLFRRAITETGELQAVRYASVSMPWFHWDYGRPQITQLEKEGTLARKGQIVGQIETSGVRKVLEEKKVDLAIAQADLNKMRVDHQAKLEQLQAELKSSMAALQSARIDTQRVEYESETRREIAGLELEKARVALHKVQRKIETTRLVQAEELKIQLAKISQTRLAIETARKTIERFTLRAPADGMIVYHKKRRAREKIRVGDQLWSGSPLIGLPDLTRIKVLTSVNETDIRNMSPGQKATVRLDAYPKIAFAGVVTKVGSICHSKESGSKIKVFDVEILLDETHRILKPGMTVSCEFLPLE